MQRLLSLLNERTGQRRISQNLLGALGQLRIVIPSFAGFGGLVENLLCPFFIVEHLQDAPGAFHVVGGGGSFLHAGIDGLFCHCVVGQDFLDALGKGHKILDPCAFILGSPHDLLGRIGLPDVRCQPGQLHEFLGLGAEILCLDQILLGALLIRQRLVGCLGQQHQLVHGLGPLGRLVDQFAGPVFVG